MIILELILLIVFSLVMTISLVSFIENNNSEFGVALYFLGFLIVITLGSLGIMYILKEFDNKTPTKYEKVKEPLYRLKSDK